MDERQARLTTPSIAAGIASSRARHRCGQVLLILGGLFYLSNLVEIATGWPLDPVRSVLSELAALDQPTSTLVRTTDTVAAVLMLAGLAVLGGRRPWASLCASSWPTRLVVAAGVLLALSTIADAALPLDCAVSQPVCAQAEHTGQVSDAHRWHTYSSVIAGFAAFLLSATTAYLWWIAAPQRKLRIVALVASTLGMLATIWIVIDEILAWPTGGVTQRIQILAFSAVVALVGWTLPLTDERGG